MTMPVRTPVNSAFACPHHHFCNSTTQVFPAAAPPSQCPEEEIRAASQGV